MYPIEVFRTTVERIVSILDAFEIRYHLTGSVVSVAWGEPRLTQDIDIVIDRTALSCHLDQLGQPQGVTCVRSLSGLPLMK